MQTSSTTTQPSTPTTTTAGDNGNNSFVTDTSTAITTTDLNRLTTDYGEQIADLHRNLTVILTNKKIELTAYKELTRCARLTLHKYYQHQEIQDAAGFYDNKTMDSQLQQQQQQQQGYTTAAGFSSTNVIDKTFNLTNMNKMKKVCQKCLTWQFAKAQLESSSSGDDEETNELIMDLFLMNDQFASAKYLIRKLKLSRRLQFRLDLGHLKHRLLNLNASSSIIVIDLEHILNECIAFADGDARRPPPSDPSVMSQRYYADERSISDSPMRTAAIVSDDLLSAAAVADGLTAAASTYVFDICFKLLNEFKDLNELNNQGLLLVLFKEKT